MSLRPDTRLVGNKEEQLALLYALKDPFIDKEEAVLKVKAKKPHTKNLPAPELQTLYILANILELPVQTVTLAHLGDNFNETDVDLKNAAILHYTASNGEMTPTEAIHKVEQLDKSLKRKIMDKNLRTLTIIATLFEKETAPLEIANHLINIQGVFHPQHQR